MKATAKVTDKLTFELEGKDVKEIFKELAMVQEIFANEKCGMCGSTNLRFVVRNVDGNDFYELRCMDCGAVLAFGQHKKGGTLFPRRKDDEGNWIGKNGWYKWDGKTDKKK